MNVLDILRARPKLFFRLSGITVGDFDDLVLKLYPLWQESEHKRLSRKGRKRAIGGGMKYILEFSEQLLLCLMYYRTYATHVFMGLVFRVSAPTVCRRVNAMTLVMVGHFRMPERKIKLTAEEQEELLFLVVDGTERPVQRPKMPGKRKKVYSGKKKRFTKKHQIITDNKKRIVAVGPWKNGKKHDKRVYDESRVIKPRGVIGLGDLGYEGTDLEIPKKKKLSKDDKKYNKAFAKLRIGVEHAIGRMKKYRIFSEIHRNNRLQTPIAKNVAALANINMGTA